MGHGYISSGSRAGNFEVRNEIGWRQFQLKLDWVTRRQLIAACLVSFFSSNRRGQIFISQNSTDFNQQRPLLAEGGLPVV